VKKNTKSFVCVFVCVNIDHVAPSDRALHNRHEKADNFIDCPANVLILRNRLSPHCPSRHLPKTRRCCNSCNSKLSI